jgi:hypothetical protein
VIAYLDLLEILCKAPNTQIEIVQPSRALVKATAAAVAPGEGETTGAAANDIEAGVDTEPIVIIKTLRDQKLEDLEMLFINMHHLINELRPHQARDNIRCILEMQKQQRIEIAQKFRSHLYKIVSLLQNCIQSIERSSSRNDENAFVDELNTLLSSANHLTKSLDKFNSKSSNNEVYSRTNGFDHNDVDMKPIQDEANNSNEETKQRPQLNSSQNKPNSESDGGTDADINTASSYNQNVKNCDFKDLILCDLIDEFLIKENEF